MKEESEIIVDQKGWRHIAVEGADRVRFLNGMVSGNIAGMSSGDWLRTLILTHKARVVSIFEVVAHDDHILLSCEPDLFQKTFDTLDRHIVMDDVELEERTLPMHTVWSDVDAVWTRAPSYRAPERVSSESAVERRRVEAGLPKYGVDVSEDNFPFESPLIRLIDYDKGCFTGQEPVARVHSRGGGGNKRLLGVRAEGPGLLSVGARLSTEERADAGVVTSVVDSERFGSIALAQVHRSAWPGGAQIRVDQRRARVVELPFAP